MLFNSLSFLVFFPVVTCLFFQFKQNWQWKILLAASCVFYMWFIPQFILILAFVIFIDYWAAILIERSPVEKRKIYLILSIISTSLVLFIFKYFNFFLDSYLPHLDLILPIGLSFHTFQSLSYVIEVYRGNQKAERNFGIYSLYVMFYPQLVAGPIERPQNLLPQFYQTHKFDYDRVVNGLMTMAQGFFKKIVLANQLSLYVDLVYNSPSSFQGPRLALATLFFAFQIYCDFSGYCDIAIGAAEVMGFKLTENFRRPYLSDTLPEFWRRWHISLSTWMRDYIYLPLGGSRGRPEKWVCNILITFMISGLWHGASWNFIVWGLLNGFLVLVKLPRSRMLTFTLICFSWIFFRATDFNTAIYIIEHLFSGWGESVGLRQNEILLLSMVILFYGYEVLQDRGPIRDKWIRLPALIRWSGYNAFVLVIMISWLWTVEVPPEFIYFQF